MKKLCFVATIPAVLHSFLKDHINACAEKWSIKIVSSPVDTELLRDIPAPFIPLAIERKASPWRDMLALVQLVILFRRERFDLVHSIMPKTGFLSMPAAWMAGVPNRVHTFTGQVWANKRGWRRRILKQFDKLIVLFATHILVDSPSQRDFLVSEGVLQQGQGIVIGHGSICGVDAHRFHPDTQTKAATRAELCISLEQTVILFLGRLNRDKGMPELAAAFADIAANHVDVMLVLVGAEEDVSFSHMQELCGKHSDRLRRVNFTPNPERYMAAADIFCLPSHREGFGQVIIEAGASGVPAVASRIYGVTDAIEEGKTGLLFPAGDATALKQALLELIENRDLRRKMGEAAQLRALELFPSDKITRGMLVFYSGLLCRN
ncbi:MAG: glycosyltransferase family 4 protein [Gallionella sp.]|nr:glycosyltransferase family 4 protein [Gallionella sp.]